MNTGEFNAEGGTMRSTSIPSKVGGGAILQVTSCFRTRDKHGPDGQLGSYTDLTLSRHLHVQHDCKAIHLPLVHRMLHLPGSTSKAFQIHSKTFPVPNIDKNIHKTLKKLNL